ncbi:AbrB family transcriptional regulator [Bacillus sp. DTU_2020_1000418_1_SI_GHA_SEK_038]|uniref:AbrB/MazE/SpoVT family DNA-binding domain-containing protein n=1 Tax=Bacillus sp. DTU_2020_1000418_1_SI_GHA_SEK_038 TaxID=3077585 RepID=UPI0028E6CB3D|nr:AbrB/MazE/SpoVT family DNA-binding domain-containing protein [Bacillus sp. DTU_2020_1000418_1_SI_GHA_SEK_038]WNS74265.1 AbrB family transcriptional regulator [Bacillus sp. DTU_2020_1000418_1_SI_GHA_SEK_038]
MKALGIIRKIDDLGRIVVPKEVRRAHGWDTNTPMEMFMSSEGLVIRKYRKDDEKSEIISKLITALEMMPDMTGEEHIKDAIEFIKKG